LECAHNIQQSIGIFRSADAKGEIVDKGLMIPIGDTSYTMGNASRLEESQEGIGEEVEQEGGEGRTLYRSRVQLDCCGGLTAHLNSHRRVFCSSTAQHSYAAASGAQQTNMRVFWRLPLLRASKQCVWVRISEVQPPCCNLAYACGPDAQASQRVPIFELISAHVSITPAHIMPAAPFIRFCSSCGLPGKISEAVSVAVGAHGAGRAHTDYVGDYRLVPGHCGSRFGLGFPVVHSPKISCDNGVSFLLFAGRV